MTLDCTGCKKGLILGTRRLKLEVTHTSLVKRTLLLLLFISFITSSSVKSPTGQTALVKRTLIAVTIILREGDEEEGDEGKVDDRKALGFGESHS